MTRATRARARQQVVRRRCTLRTSWRHNFDYAVRLRFRPNGSNESQRVSKLVQRRIEDGRRRQGRLLAAALQKGVADSLRATQEAA